MPAARKRYGAAKKARIVMDRPPQLQGWNTSDEEEVALRGWRGRPEVTAIETLEPKHPMFGRFRVRSESGNGYDIEIRSLDQRVNFVQLHRSPC